MKPLYTEIDFSYLNRQVAKNGEVFKNVANRANVLHEERCPYKKALEIISVLDPNDSSSKAIKIAKKALGLE